MSGITTTNPQSARLALLQGRRFLNNLTAWISLGVLLLLLIFSLFPEVLSPYDPIRQRIVSRLENPSMTHLFGTDELGRDIFSRVIHGSRVSVGTAVLAVLFGVLMGVPIGLLGGYAGGLLDELLTRATDILLSFPPIILAMALIAVMGRNPIMVAVVIGIVSAPAFIRVTRATTLKTKGLAFVDAIRLAGASGGYIMFATILPNCVSQIYVQGLLTASRAVLLESGLSFLGLGLPPPAPSWGSMLESGRNYLYEMPWYGIFPGIFLAALVLALQILSDSLRKALKL